MPIHWEEIRFMSGLRERPHRSSLQRRQRLRREHAMADCRAGQGQGQDRMPLKSNAALSITLALFGSMARATPKDEVPPVGAVYNNRELSRIRFDCRFIDNRGESAFQPTDRIACEFNQVSLVMPSAQDSKNELAKSDQDFEIGWKEEMSKRPFTELKKLCRKPEDREFQDSQRRRFQSNKYAAALLPGLGRGQRAYDQLCSCADKTCFHDAFKAVMLQEAKEKAETCEIFSTAWKTRFRRVGETWVSID